MLNLKEIFPFEAIGPAIGGAIIWFGANYAFIGPELIGPRLQEKYYAPMCHHAVEAGRAAEAERQQTLIDNMDKRLGELRDTARSQARNSIRSFFQMYGREGQAYWDYYGDDIGNGISGLADAPLNAQIAQQRSQLLGQLETQKAEHRANVRHATAEAYCGCVIEEALGERFDLAAYSASLRLYTPPTIKNIESGAAFDGQGSCGAAPTI